MSTVDKQTAVQDFERWLTFKRISDNKRADSQDQEEIIVEAIESGKATIDDDCVIKFKLEFPVENQNGEKTLLELNFMPRLKVKILNKYLKGVKANDADGRILSHIAALTATNPRLIEELDTTDYNFCQSIVMYFL